MASRTSSSAFCTPRQYHTPYAAALNATSHYNQTAYLTWLNGTAASVEVGVPHFDAYGGWTYAVTPTPTHASREELEWTFHWSCRGYASQCSTEWRIEGVGLFARVDVEYDASDHVDVTYTTTLTDKAMVDEKWWEAVCGNSTGYCPPYPTTERHGGGGKSSGYTRHCLPAGGELYPVPRGGGG